MAQTIKLTSKRQATFPVQLCQEMGISAGDSLLLERRKIDGDMTWLIRSEKPVESTWFGAFKDYAGSKAHDMDSIRASVGKRIGMEKA